MIEMCQPTRDKACNVWKAPSNQKQGAMVEMRHPARDKVAMFGKYQSNQRTQWLECASQPETRLAILGRHLPTGDKVAMFGKHQPNQRQGCNDSNMPATQKQACNGWKASAEPETDFSMIRMCQPTRDKACNVWKAPSKPETRLQWLEGTGGQKQGCDVRMHLSRNILEFSSQTKVRFLLLVRDTGYTVASRVVLHRGSGAVLLPRDQAEMLSMPQLTRAANHGQFTTINCC